MPSRPATPAQSHFFARYGDGRSAQARDAKVSFGISGLKIDLGPGTQAINWSYDSLRVADPLRATAIDTLISSPDAPGASLFVPGPDFAAKLGAQVPRLTARAERRRHTRPWLILVGLGAALLALIYVGGFSPIKSFASVVPQSWRERLGDEARDSMTEDYRPCNDARGLAALDTMVARLSKAAGRAKPFKVTVYDWSLMNAFAVPGGQIVMTRGLIDKAQSPDEVAGVLAHEMGHGLELHPETNIIRAIGLAAAVELMLGGSGGSLANIGLVLAQLSYTRVAEREADEIALKVLKDAGVSPKGLGDFFKRVSEMEGEADGVKRAVSGIDLLRTHPPTAERTAMVRAQAPYPSTPVLSDAEWNDLRTVCKSTRTRDGSGDNAALPQ